MLRNEPYFGERPSVVFSVSLGLASSLTAFSFPPPPMPYSHMHANPTDPPESVDCWAVGVLTYEFLVGHTPFRPPPSPQKQPGRAAAGGGVAAAGGGVEQEQNRLYSSILHGKVQFPAHVSLSARDFIDKLLNSDPRKRMRLEEALGHRWICFHHQAEAAAPAAAAAAAAVATAAAAAAAAGVAAVPAGAPRK